MGLRLRQRGRREAQLRRGGDPLAKLDADAIHVCLAYHCRGEPDDALGAALVRMVHAAATP